MTRTLTIRWEATAGDPSRVRYFVDESPVGEDDDGFDRILDLVRADDDTDVMLRIRSSPSLGGGPLLESLPFRGRIEELRQALGDNTIAYDFG